MIRATIMATPSSDNGWMYEVRTDAGDVHFLAGPGAPQGYPVGAYGVITYMATGTRAYYAWSPAREKESDDVLLQ